MKFLLLLVYIHSFNHLNQAILNYYYITGTSRGIGKAFAEYLLEDPSNYVIGISREKTIEHPNYRHFFLT